MAGDAFAHTPATWQATASVLATEKVEQTTQTFCAIGPENSGQALRRTDRVVQIPTLARISVESRCSLESTLKIGPHGSYGTCLCEHRGSEAIGQGVGRQHIHRHTQQLAELVANRADVEQRRLWR